VLIYTPITYFLSIFYFFLVFKYGSLPKIKMFNWAAEALLFAQILASPFGVVSERHLDAGKGYAQT